MSLEAVSDRFSPALIMSTSRTAMNAIANHTVGRARLTERRLLVTLAVLTGALLLVLIIAIAFGSERVGVTAILKIIGAEITGRAADVTPEQRLIIVDIRLPRALMAM